MKKKGTLIALLLLLLSGLGLYFAYLNGGTSDRKPSGTSAPPEMWQTTGPDGSYAPTSLPPATESTGAPTSASTAASTAASAAATTSAAANPPQTQASNGGGGYAYAGVYEGIQPAVAVNATGNPYLILVNRHYSLPPDYQPALAVCVPSYQEKKEMEQTAAAQYKRMYDAAMQEGAELIPYSGYRSTARQKGNFDRLIGNLMAQGMSRAQAVNLAAKSIMPPGCSEHEAGLAMDITRPGYWDTRDDFADTKEFKWLRAHAHEYGFILRYPAEKEDITEVQFEPWHWRYVGVEDAGKIRESGLCLEEYLARY